MKRLKTGVVNTLSFVKLNSFTVNSFDVTLEKVVGVGSLTITNLTDINNLDICKDFIVINIDLILNNIEGGEYILSITNSGETYSYLTEVQDYQYNALGTGIYADSVYVSNEVDADAPSEQQPDTGTGTGSSSNSMSIALRDDTYGNMTSPYYLRTDSWTAQAGITSIGSSITKIKFTITDSDAQEISKIVAVTDHSFESVSFDIESEAINFGDVANWVIEGLSSTDEVLYTSTAYTLIIPPKISLYIAESLSAANDMRTNGSSAIDILNGSSTTYNLYAYLESNTVAQIFTHNRTAVNDRVFSNVVVGAIDGTSAFSISPTEGSMELVSSDVAPAWAYETSERNIKYYCYFTWAGGYTTPLLNNIAGLYNTFAYGEDSSGVNQRPYPKETLTIGGTTFTLEGFSPITYNSLTAYTNSRLALYMGSGTYQMSINYVNSLAVQQEYSDGTTEETIVTKAQLNSAVFPAMLGDSFDVYTYVSRINSSKTLVHNKVWIKYGTYWFNIDNSSVDSPHFLLEL